MSVFVNINLKRKMCKILTRISKKFSSNFPAKSNKPYNKPRKLQKEFSNIFPRIFRMTGNLFKHNLCDVSREIRNDRKWCYLTYFHICLYLQKNFAREDSSIFSFFFGTRITKIFSLLCRFVWNISWFLAKFDK